MNRDIATITKLADACQCGNLHNTIPVEEIVVGKNALEQAVSFLQNKGFQHTVLIADQRTYKAAGEKLANLLTQSMVFFTVCIIEPDENGEVIADEAAIVQALLGIPRDADVLLAVGSGTLHDIVRFCSDKMSKPFVSIPTAPSVDGFTSMGAPLIVGGMKETFQATAPISVFADLDILMNAPTAMISAGFGDMAAKFTSLADWKFGSLMADEIYCPIVAKLTKEALESCVAHQENIAIQNEEGITVLMEALILSGLAMLILGQSHPASGGEHHLSHYWEMELLKEKRPQILHGAKVFVSTTLISQLYKEEVHSLLLDPSEINNRWVRKKVEDNKLKIIAILDEIPDSEQIRNMIEKTGGASTTEELGLDDELVMNSMMEAHTLRDRFTMLKLLNGIGD